MADNEEIQKDIALLEKVLMRLAVSEDDQLQKQVNSLIVPVLSKLQSPHEVTRKKVLIL